MGKNSAFKKISTRKVYILTLRDIKLQILLIVNKIIMHLCKKNSHLKNISSEKSSYFNNLLQISLIFGEIVYLWGKKRKRKNHVLKNISHEENSYFDI